MALIPDINATGKWLIESTLSAGFGEKLDDQLADAGILLQSPERELSGRTLINREGNDRHFAISRIGDTNVRAQFFYRSYRQYGTGLCEDDNLACIATSR